MACAKCEELSRELNWLKHELSLVPVSRQRMMRRTHVMMAERDSAVARLKNLEEKLNGRS